MVMQNSDGLTTAYNGTRSPLRGSNPAEAHRQIMAEQRDRKRTSYNALMKEAQLVNNQTVEIYGAPRGGIGVKKNLQQGKLNHMHVIKGADQTQQSGSLTNLIANYEDMKN